MAKVLRAGVIGAGVFGGYHAAQWAGFADVTLTAVLDNQLERAAAVAGPLGASAFADLASFLEAVDLVSVCTPAAAHGDLVLAALRAGKPVYVEKPLAVSLDQADAIEALAARRDLVVACGFLERAAFEAIGLFAAPRPPLRLEATRFGLATPRNLDVSVVLDLMIHDLDLALAVAGAAPLAVEAEGVCEANRSLDRVDAEITFENGFTATLHASRIATSRQRTMTLVYPSGEIEIDGLNRTFSNTTGFDLDPAYAETAAGRDPLGASLAAFLGAVRGERPGPMAGAADGARALDLALAVERAVGG